MKPDETQTTAHTSEDEASSENEESTGDPGRTPGKAEGVEDPEKEGNE